MVVWPQTSQRIYRFAAFEADLWTGELRKGGVRLKVQEQPLKLLAMLLARPGELVTREQLHEGLWSSDTFVDFDRGLNTAVNRLRTALGDSAEKPRFVETVGKRGYRFIAPITGDEQEPLAIAELVGQLFGRTRWRANITAVAIAILTVGILIGFVRPHLGRDHGRISSIAVMPFANVSGDPDTEYLSDGITESLIDDLARVPQLKVKSRNSVFRYKGKEVDAQKVGNDLGVSALVTGRMSPRGDNIEVSADLTDVRDSTIIWGQHYRGKSTDIISLQRQIALDIVEELRASMSHSEKQQITKQGTLNPEAYELYLKGRYSWNKRTAADIAVAVSYFNQAIAKDPGFALAYSGLADAYGVLPSYRGNPGENYPKSSAAARKALELDPTLAHPHANLGGNEMDYGWDLAGGEAEYRKAFELDPNDATAHQYFAGELSMIGGREKEALAEINLARQLDPMSPIINWAVGDVLIRARRYDEGIAVCKKLANENPKFVMAYRCLGQAYWGKRIYSQVIEEWKTIGELSGDRNESEFALATERGFHSGGWKIALTKGIDARQEQRKTGYSSAYAIGSMYADLGNADQAFRWLNTAYQERDFYLLGLKNDFALDPVRSDARFAELLRRVGLPQ